MEQSTFEKLGIQTSVLGFGCMRLPTKDGQIDRQAALDMVDYAYKNGITYFDTAYPYHSQTSEPFMGEALKRYPRESFYLATKCPVWLCESAEDFERIFNEQLSRLQTDYFDFYLMHSMTKERFDNAEKIGIYDLIRKKQAEGKIRYVGFSFHDKFEVFQEMLEKHTWDFVQIQYNYIDPYLLDADKLYNELEARDIPCIVMEPLRGGFLSNLPESFSSIFTGYALDRSVSSWGLRWVASHKNVKVVLSGMSNMEQLVDNMNTFSQPFALSQEEQSVVGKVVDAIKAVGTVPCTGCAYCMPCPFGVNIPKVFSIYNNYKMFQFAHKTKDEYFNQLAPENRADLCRNCKKCMQVCPQHIKIPELLKEADTEIHRATAGL